MRSYASTLILLLTAITAYSKDWTFLYRKDGIEVYSDNASLPTYRAEGTLDVDIVDIIAVFSYVPRRVEWVRYLGESRVIADNHVDRVLVYSHYLLPWPATDRDSVIETTYKKNYQAGELTVNFHSIDLKDEPRKKNVIRVPKADGVLNLRVLDKGKTLVRYEVNLDQGGRLPQWICNFFIRDAPMQMLQAMKQRVVDEQYLYKNFRDSQFPLWHARIQNIEKRGQFQVR